MKMNNLSGTARHRRSVSEGGRSKKTAAAIAELLMIEECVERCECLAETLIASGISHPLVGQLSECISACENYMAAKSRESSYESRLARFAHEVLGATSQGCRQIECDASIRCRMACDIARGFIANTTIVRDPLWN